MTLQPTKTEYTKFQLAALVALRFVIGWHFLYEGIVKISNQDWSSTFFLNESRGIFSGFFQWLASQAIILNSIDFINVWALTLIGICLIGGIFVRSAAYTAALLLFLYYLAVPPWPGLDYAMNLGTGNYLIVNINIIELAGLLVIIGFPTAHIAGFERLINKKNYEASHG